jgi:hypothetical protein
MIPVDVNATFNTIGNIKPVYVRIENEHHELHTYKIQTIEFYKEENKAGINNAVKNGRKTIKKSPNKLLEPLIL